MWSCYSFTKRKLYVLDRTSTTSQKMHALLIRLFLVLKNDIENHIQNKWSFLYAAFWLVANKSNKGRLWCSCCSCWTMPNGSIEHLNLIGMEIRKCQPEKNVLYIKSFALCGRQLALAQIALPPLLRTKWRVRSWVLTH